MIYIGIPTINLVDHLDRTINSIECQNDYRLLIVNNGDKNEFLKWQAISEVTFETILNKQNKGVAASWNQIIDWALSKGDAEVIFILNDDILLHPNCINRMLETIRRKRYGAVSGGMVAGAPERMWNFNEDMVDDRHISGMHFSCFAITPDVVTTIGKFDVGYGLCYVEDTDYFYRLEKAKVRKGCDRWAWFTHYRVRDRRISGRKKSHRYNRGYFQRKWGTPPKPVAKRMMDYTRI